MEEVDQIIIGSLLNIGCEFAEGLESLKQFTTDNVVEGTVKCLRIINPDYKMSHIFPPGMSARFRVGTSIANACKEAGYRGDVGYQTFLYSAERDVRQIFMFLVEKLPRKEGVKEDIESASVLQRRIGQVLREKCAVLWMPFYCHTSPKKIPFRTQPINISKYSQGYKNSKSQDETTYDFVHRQIKNRDQLTPSLLELNSKQTVSVTSLDKASGQDSKRRKVQKEAFQWKHKSMITDKIPLDSSFDDVIQAVTGNSGNIKQSRFAHAKSLQFTTEEQKSFRLRPTVPQKPSHLIKHENKKKDDAETDNQESSEDGVDGSSAGGGEDAVIPEEPEEVKFKREEEEIKVKILDADAGEEKYKEELKMVELSIKQLMIKTEELETNNEEEVKNVKLKEKTLKLLPNAEENMEKLKSLVDASSKRLVELGRLWEEKRVPLIEDIRRLKQSKTESEFDAERKVEEIRMLRTRMKDVAEETKLKDQLTKQLKAELESVKRDISRQSYTRRILEIVASIHKQKQEIQRVIQDVKQVQKTMNRLKGRAERTFSAADEVIFKDAKHDEGSKQAYKYLVSLHDNCATLLKTVEETGLIMREIRDFEGQIDIETGKNAEENLEKILKDYKEIKKENTEMIKRLKQK
uniref:coiled-coil domain-containing protein 22 homolog n=1 Tax=Ciona intestinalis TaxID=7719 RepID=UPI00006A3BE0|nr:coiled-coil domain-containing protein 22 homolog [Ciona intestinalis]|eukprot:XP_026693321.1 coiled-coil domain-containing protein 22 homolog [Ciona intestinalis]